MSATVAIADFELPHVDAELHYLAPMTEQPRSYTYDPPPGIPRSNIVRETRVLPIYSARPVASSFSLDVEGFAVLRRRSAVHDFWDEEELRAVYYPEVEQTVKDITGASKVFVFDHTLRKRVHGVDDRAPGTPRQPVPAVHVDHTEKSGPQRVRDFFGDAETLLRGRVQVINLWRPIRGPLRDAPLAICDARSVAPDSLVLRLRSPTAPAAAGCRGAPNSPRRGRSSRSRSHSSARNGQAYQAAYRQPCSTTGANRGQSVGCLINNARRARIRNAGVYRVGEALWMPFRLTSR